MTAPRRPRERRLTAEERRLWAEIARLVTPLPGRPEPEPAPAQAPAAAEPPSPPPSPPASRPIAAPRATVPVRPALPPLAPMERRVRTALRRGSRTVDAVIDLHGLRQAEAHAALIGFLHRSRSAGHALVLVVTGKGGAGDDTFAERGVLRRSVPHWLRLPDLRPLVLGFEEAALHHGGSGALYVRLRRRGP
ncbi:Smr/MutS family protein [Methylobacterium isbiliense]|uniref:Endonuclease MutS2 n=1 Tax=Methylobacterium isbiliense TaxID=315478 RepID=A0ABQ4SNT7_9HYPH|nr:Smr/MutS family protein [Methylobacterium isbiliense]GJE03414.1 Endonuclease MutS2 [Methylobacterium isbiliense]